MRKLKVTDLVEGRTYKIGYKQGKFLRMQGKIAVLEYKAKLVYANPNDGIEEIKEPEDSNQTQTCECCGKELPVNKFQRVRGGNYRKTCKACNKKGQPVSKQAEEPTEETEQLVIYTEEPVKPIVPDNVKDSIKPGHYNQGDMDLFEIFYHQYPFNEFRTGMRMIAARYYHRYPDKNGMEDYDKGDEVMRRLREYEEREANGR
ncbi:DUF3310 domain-containing protein [Abiotrophia defectiva]|uniref:DUF3310 domain-containing protein n=1 Tax=Abiotrophia defectiva TaxID=46125 RepID=UPI0028D8EEE3|nr:DUF3310 domain-containing protein [Abiotrophia defectiva]